MAEFVVVMRKIRELCDERTECKGCIMMNDIACGVTTGTPCLSEEEIERRVAQWEAAKYPTWYEFQVVRFPNHKRWICPMAFGATCPNNGAGREKTCAECRNDHIPAEIAEKLGIRPREAR
nr:MAG TPA: hypothetical protein [Caudoviricetes sp.]